MASDFPPLRHGMRLAVTCALISLAAACTTLDELGASLSRMVDDTSAAETGAQGAAQKMQAAIEAAQPRRSNLARARKLLTELLAAEDAESRELHPYARALLDQVQERQRLAQVNARLQKTLDAQAVRLQESEQRNAVLEGKLDALAEIETELKRRSSERGTAASSSQ